MVLTKQFKLCPTKEQTQILDIMGREYISLINDILDYAISLGQMPMLSSASVHAPLPSTVRGQCTLDARSIWRKTKKLKGKFPVLRKPVIVWNNQNYKISESSISVPVYESGKTHRIQIKALIPHDVFNLLKNSKLGTLRISKKNSKYIAQISYEAAESMPTGTAAMGIDLGIKCPAVAVFNDGTVRFYGNGRQNKFVRRKYAKRRKKLGKVKKMKALKKMDNKEQRWMKDQDHKLSRQIINEAISRNVGTIKLEALSGISAATRKSRKNNHSLHNWSFYRLSLFIEYKAKLAGIKVEYVNPAYTSQTCPICGCVHKANDRTYICPDCDYKSHRDIIGARNILAA